MPKPRLSLAEGLPRLFQAMKENRLLIQQQSRPMLCRYRHNDLVCAIGAMLPTYDPSFEGRRVTALPFDIDPELIEIQTQHDAGDLPRFVQFLKERRYCCADR